MKKLHKLFIIIGVVLVVIVLGYQLVVATVSTELFDAMKYSSFRLGMSSRRAKSLFSARGELVKVSVETKDYGVVTELTFESGSKIGGASEEELTLVFLNDELYSVYYDNLGIPFE